MSTTRMPASAPLLVRSSQGKDLLEKRLHVLGRFLAPFGVAADHGALAYAGARVVADRARDVLARRADCHHEPVQICVEVAARTGDDVLGVHGRAERIEAVKGVRVHDHGHVGVDRKSTRLNSSHVAISYAVFCLKKKKKNKKTT